MAGRARLTLQPIAPGAVGHLALFSAIILVESCLWATRRELFVAAHGRVALYMVIAGSELLEVAYVLVSVRRLRISVRELVGPLGGRPGAMLRDGGIAVTFWLASGAVLYATQLLLDIPDDDTSAYLIPNTGAEIGAALALCALAGVCEEIMFRGYLQHVTARVTGRGVAGVLISAVLFGLGHGYLGRERMSLVVVEGLMYGGLTSATRRLRPAMMAHALGDMVALVARRFVLP